MGVSLQPRTTRDMLSGAVFYTVPNRRECQTTAVQSVWYKAGFYS